jgi:hypothetical protein
MTVAPSSFPDFALLIESGLSRLGQLLARGNKLINRLL